MADVEEEGLRRWARRGGGRGAGMKGRGWRKGDRAEVGWWSRFRDDCLALFRGTQAEFRMFVATMNSVEHAIKFTSEIDFEKNCVNFLDMTITITPEGFLTTDLYTKPNTLNQLLLPSSAHPPSVTRSSVYSQALRYRRICATDDLFELRVAELEKKLRDRGYSAAVVEAGIQRARDIPRGVALEKSVRQEPSVEEESGRQHRLVTQYDRRSSPALSQILKNNHGAAGARDKRFITMFPKIPKPAFSRGTNVKQLLVKAKGGVQ